MKESLVNQSKSFIDEKFKQFLCNNNIVKKYLDNYYNDSTGIHFENVINPEYYIHYTFVWWKTPEGSDFWMRIRDKWVNKLWNEYFSSNTNTKKNKLLKL